LRRYGPDLKLTAKRPASDGKQPYGVAIDPSGRGIAVGYVDGTPVSILDAKTLAPLAKAQTDDLNTGDLFSVAWSRDGGTLVAGGWAHEPFPGWERQRVIMRRCDVSGRRRGADVAASGDTIDDIQPCGEGFAFAAQDPLFGLLSAQGSESTLQGPRSPDMRGKRGSAFTVARDATRVRFGLNEGDEKPVLIDLAAASLADSPNIPPSLTSAKLDGLPVTDWKNEFKPKFDGKPLALHDNEMSRALAVRGFGPSTRAARNAGNSRARAKLMASISRPMATSSSSPTVTARSAGCAGRTARSCWRCSSSRRAANGSRGPPRAITWPRPAART
jgi:hypothetical protein